MSDLIRWEPNGHGTGWHGFAGTHGRCLYRLWDNGAEWELSSAGGATRMKASGPGGPDVLKARAEELLREFAASIGAVFPEPGPGGYVTAYGGTRTCRYCPDPARWDVGGLLACPDLDHVERALEDLTASKES